MSYFKDNKKNAAIEILKITQTDIRSIEKNLGKVFGVNKDIQSVFVTNSRVSSVAAWLDKAGVKNVLLIGYDILKENVKYLEKGTIEFLICHKPEEQGYRGIMAHIKRS
jgi:LacI family transcriptional regulator